MSKVIWKVKDNRIDAYLQLSGATGFDAGCFGTSQLK
jgi:hypothetical protein